MLKDNEKKVIKDQFAQKEDTCKKMINLFALLSNKIRFRILCLLLEGDYCVTDIVDIIQIGKISNVSQQLKLLTMSGLIESRREKKQIFYNIKNDKIRDLIAYLKKDFLDIE